MTELKLLSTQTYENDKAELYEIADYKVQAVFEDEKLDFIQIYTESDERFIPNIYYRKSLATKKQEFTIQSTSYGDLNVTDFQKMMNYYQQALEVVEVLTATFIK